MASWPSPDVPGGGLVASEVNANELTEGKSAHVM